MRRLSPLRPSSKLLRAQVPLIQEMFKQALEDTIRSPGMVFRVFSQRFKGPVPSSVSLRALPSHMTAQWRKSTQQTRVCKKAALVNPTVINSAEHCRVPLLGSLCQRKERPQQKARRQKLAPQKVPYHLSTSNGRLSPNGRPLITCQNVHGSLRDGNVPQWSDRSKAGRSVTETGWVKPDLRH